jgi:hypothetical protein
MSYPGQQGADALRRATIAAQQSQYHAERKAKQQTAQRVAAARRAPHPQVGTPHPSSGVYGQPPRRITAPPPQQYYGSTGRYVDEDDWIAVVVGVIVIVAAL